MKYRFAAFAMSPLLMLAFTTPVFASTATTTATTTDTVAPSTPTGLTGAAVLTSQIILSWGPSTDNVGVTGYHIYRNGTYLGPQATTTYSDTGLIESTTYTYTVDAFDAAGNTSVQSSAVSVTTQAAVPPPPPPFTINARVKTTGTVNVRSKAAINGKIVCIQPTGATGTIVGGPTSANGYTWWNVKFTSGCTGWAVQNYLTTVFATGINTQRLSQIETKINTLMAQITELRLELQAAVAANVR